jgi:phage protein U
MFATLGEIVFQVLTSPEAMALTSAYSYAEHKVVEAPPRLQWLANELDELSLDLRFHFQYVNPVTQLSALRAAGEDHLARALVLSNGVHLGYFIIERLEQKNLWQADDGSYIAIDVKLELKQWVPGVEFDPLAPPKRTTRPAGLVAASPAPAATSGAPPGMPAANNRQPFNPAQPIGPHNLLPTSAIVQLSQAGAGPGVTYSPVPYTQPGVSGVAGQGSRSMPPGNFMDVPGWTIVRAGY